MYTIKKIYNNNVSLVDCNGTAKIVTGVGIAFKKKIGDTIDEGMVLEQYVLEKDAHISSYDEMFINISSEELGVMNEVITYGARALNVSFGSRTKLAIVDHLYYAIKRYKDGTELKSGILWNLKRIYRKEYQVAINCIDMVNRRLNVKLCEDECGFLTLHFINVTYSSNERTTAIAEAGIINDILKIIGDYFKIKLDEEDDRLERFVIHLRYMIKKASTREPVKTSKNKSLFEYCSVNYKREHQCSKLIQKYLVDRFDYNINEDELLYLTVHMVNLLA